MNYKLIWTVIASLGVVTQVPGMIESHLFNECHSKLMEDTLDYYREDPTPSAYNREFYETVNQCNGGN